ncbi:MAG: DUF493 domain-containing protein [Bacteroidales bacterium]|nr:DUF493 domain-containing protein [Bacteroidales bacterium]MCF8349612.1 DUF493 domain-containing protein [Bacteroidales bacterium]MCF8376053.1 DUF493 domain-containing protein [Bacteroidales bacterium]MCF8400414.1 DUF493 domain-containing protein [Bacteroidales bacterium]
MLLNKACVFKDEKVEFPVDYRIKVIMDTSVNDETNRSALNAVFKKLDIPAKEWKSKQSSKGNYTSYTIKIEVDRKETFDALYREMRLIDNVKWAV